MPAVLNQKIIPSYSLPESSSTESDVFEIVESNGEWRKRKADFLVPHRKDYYMLVLVKKGSSRHWVDGIPYVLQPNTLYFSTPEQVHVKEKSEPFQGTLVYFTREFLHYEENDFLNELPIIQNPDNQHLLELTPANLKFIHDILDKMLAEYHDGRDWRNSMLLSYLRVLLIYVSRLYAQQYENNSSDDRLLLRKFRDQIDVHFSSLHQVADYAKILSITPGYLSEVIKMQSGKTAIEHIHERIVLEAKRHLLHTDWSMKEIAHTLGFEDAAYFGRFFKRITSESPAAYRDAIRKMYH